LFSIFLLFTLHPSNSTRLRFSAAAGQAFRHTIAWKETRPTQRGVETFGPSATDIAGEDLPITSVNPDILNAKILSPEIGNPIPKPVAHPYVSPISIRSYPTSTPSSTFSISTSSLSVDSTTIETFSTSTVTSTIINSSTLNQ